MIEAITVDPRIKVRKAYNLLLIPKVITVQSFDEAGAAQFRKDMSLAHRTGQTIIPVVIDSFGGDVYSLLSMVDTIHTAQLPIATVIQGKAMSCGAVLFSCGSSGYRFIAPNATLMIHEVSQVGHDLMKVEEVKSNAKETQRLNDKMLDLLDKNCRKRQGFFRKYIAKNAHADWYLTPEEAVRLNLANHIQIPTLRTTVSVNTSLEF